MDALLDEEYDVIIVGSGPGGGSVAHELSRRVWKALVLEKGGGEPLRGTAAQLIPMALIPGKSLHFTEQMVGLIHGLTVGGSSAISYANAFEPPYEMFDKYGIDLRPEVDEVKRKLPIAPLADALLGPAARRIMDSARQLGYEWNRLPKIVYQDKCRILTDLVLPRWLYWLFTAQVLRFDRLPAHSRTLPIMVKARDELGGHLTRRGAVRKRLGPGERQRLLGGYEKACQILRNAGARHIYKSWYLAVHPGGTVKIGEFVDSNLKTELDNLYICDCSVIPEAWGLPPTLTLLALGKRLGQHLS